MVAVRFIGIGSLKTPPRRPWLYRLVIGFTIQPLMESVPITAIVMSLNPVHCEVYSIQHYVINFVRELLQVGGFLPALQFPPPIKLK